MNRITTNLRKGFSSCCFVCIAQLLSFVILRNTNGYVPEEMMNEVNMRLVALITSVIYTSVNFLKHYQKTRL